MGILDVPGQVVGGVTGAINSVKNFIANPLSKSVPNLNPPPDFPEGMIIKEIVEGKVQTRETVRLVGTWLPKQPFNFGGKQRIVKDFYPGQSEPVVHILGPEETDLTISGTFSDKNLKIDPQRGIFRGVALELQQQIDAIRIRGNLIELTLGEWRRYGFLEETDFKMRTIADLDYNLSFSIIGFNPPLNCNIVDTEKSVPFEINKDLIGAAAAFQTTYSQVPGEIPQSIADVLNGIVSDVAGVLSTVTDFVDTTLGAVEDIGSVITRAVGVVKYAKTEILRARMRIGRIAMNAQLAGIPVPQRYTSAAFITGMAVSTMSLSAILSQLQERFEQLRASTPQARHRVTKGDTLHTLAVQYYEDVGQWEAIYEHNSLTSTELEQGAVLEIPRL